MEEKLRQQESNCIKIVMFGPESTGKTTLAKQLALHYNSCWVPEYSRIYAEEKLNVNSILTKEDVLPIAIGQMELENRLAKKAKGILFCDTNLLETKIYSEIIYNQYSPEILNKYALLNSYDLYILTDIDIPWQYDPVRSDEISRDVMFDKFKNVLVEYNLPYIIVSGNEEKRLKKAIKHIDLLKNHRNY